MREFGIRSVIGKKRSNAGRKPAVDFANALYRDFHNHKHFQKKLGERSPVEYRNAIAS
ncbi:hypothetical protein [Paenibacillus lutimineralis]|uniref:hypothetical protein n=1 Tax=Paenibacillus lutimineralis TaxID=2707005 RepID=UPI0013A61409|nr:hypothetical protein [Paenibacillus lutimineralis]